MSEHGKQLMFELQPHPASQTGPGRGWLTPVCLIDCTTARQTWVGIRATTLFYQQCLVASCMPA